MAASDELPVPADELAALEARLASEHGEGSRPQSTFERSFGLQVLARSRQRLAEEAQRHGRESMYQRLVGYLTVDPPVDALPAIAAELGIGTLALQVSPTCDPALPPGAEPIGGGWVSIDRGGRWLWNVHNHPGRQLRVRAIDLADCVPRAEFIRPVSAGQQPHPRAIGNSLVVYRMALNSVLVFDVNGKERTVHTVATTSLIQDFDASEDGTLIVQATRDAVQFFDLQRGARLSSLLSAPIPGDDGIGEVRFSAEANRLRARTAQGRWLPWDLTMSPRDARQLTRLMHEVELPAVAEPGAESPFVPLDLRSVLNVRLDGSWPSRATMVGDLLSLGVGRHRLLGVDLRIDGGVPLRGGGPASVLHPEHPATDWVPVLPVSARRVHLLMLHHIPMRIGEQPRVTGRIWLRAEDGAERVLDILSQERVVTQWLADAVRGAGGLVRGVPRFRPSRKRRSGGCRGRVFPVQPRCAR